MHQYQIAGTGKKTGRKRNRVYSAPTELAARKMAEDDETEVETVVKLPPEPASEAQLEYANDLNISIPNNASKADVSALISRNRDNDKLPTARHRGFAAIYAVETNEHIGKKSLFDAIHADLSLPGREKELLAWFAFRVYRGLVKGAENVAFDSPNDPVFITIADELKTDEKIVESVRRYRGNKLIWFGQWTAPNGNQYDGGSIRTAAYKKIVALLRERVELPTLPKKSRTRTTAKPAADQDVTIRRVIVSLVVVGLFLYLFV